MDSTLLSAFSLCASNNGEFKSSKQAEFFARKFGKELVAVESYSFGEHNGSRCSASYSVLFDTVGITSITKAGAKVETTFVRGGVNQYAENKARKARLAEAMRNDVLAIEIPYCETTIASKLADIQMLREEIAEGILSNSPVYQRCIAKQEAEVAELRARLDRLRAEYEVA
jgi:hypothetical protein